jgi:hypothetical protein
LCCSPAFQPIFPVKDKNCLVVVRVEDDFLSEIENTFCDIFIGFLRPNGSLPMGSVVLFGSVSHLGTRGLNGNAACPRLAPRWVPEWKLSRGSRYLSAELELETFSTWMPGYRALA